MTIAATTTEIIWALLKAVAAARRPLPHSPVTSPDNNSDTSVTETAPTAPETEQGIAADQQLNGYLALVANQLVYIKTDRPAVYWAATLTQFESDECMYDVAAGSNDTTSGAMPASAVAPATPIAALGFRVNKFVQRSAQDEVIGDQRVVGRIAVSLTERESSVRTGEAAEQMHFIIDNIELATNASGELVAAHALAGAHLHLYGRNARGIEVRETIPVPVNAVRLQSMEPVLDVYGDKDSVVRSRKRAQSWPHWKAWPASLRCRSRWRLRK